MYKVKKNDTLYGISRKFKVNPAEISQNNGNPATGKLSAGEILRIPVGTPTKSANLDYPTAKKPDIIRKFSSSPLYPYKGVLFKSLPSTTVTASAKGKVVATDYIEGYDNYIIIKHADGISTVYANLEKIYVIEGQEVDRNEKLGKYIQDKGLYFQINKNQEPVNPLAYIK